MQYHELHGGRLHRGPSQTTELSKLVGGPLIAQGWVLAWDHTVGYILGSHVGSLTSGECEHKVLICVQWS